MDWNFVYSFLWTKRIIFRHQKYTPRCGFVQLSYPHLLHIGNNRVPKNIKHNVTRFYRLCYIKRVFQLLLGSQNTRSVSAFLVIIASACYQQVVFFCKSAGKRNARVVYRVAVKCLHSVNISYGGRFHVVSAWMCLYYNIALVFEFTVKCLNICFYIWYDLSDVLGGYAVNEIIVCCSRKSYLNTESYVKPCPIGCLYCLIVIREIELGKLTFRGLLFCYAFLQ